MTMVRIKDVRQIPGEPFRQWYTGRNCDLIIWYSDSLTIQGFQFCYRLGQAERALTWMEGRGDSHHGIDSGDLVPGGPKRSPVLVPDGKLSKTVVRGIFNKESRQVRTTVVRWVNEKLDAYPG
jgi:hypothetical protein